MKAIIRYTIITAFRDLLFLGLLFLVIITVGVANFLGETAVSEQKSMQLVYTAGSLRMIIMIGLILFVCFHIKRLFDSKEIEVLLSRPISRTDFILSYWLSFTILSAILTVSAILIVLALNEPNPLGLIYWGGSLIFEGAIVIAFAFLASLIMKSAIAAALSSFCFYFLSRMMGFFLSSYKDFVSSIPDLNNFWQWLNQMILKLVSIIIPRLDMFGKTNWLVYGIQKDYDIWLYPLQSAIFIPLLLLVAIFDFRRKQF